MKQNLGVVSADDQDITSLSEIRCEGVINAGIAESEATVVYADGRLDI